ncbi:MAG: acyl-CoA ligase (AMP-forming), exosortase A system-associated, partial [Gammaproteobacteria bacterium]|nr:acyl-CoA ligase (AMP-forming), exosortase A system-associated [Gammaproteobacteria bacterium]
LGVPHPELDQAIVVLLACKQGIEPDLATWQLQLKRSLPNFMQPKAMLLTEGLPKNANGKIDRKLLSEQYRDYFQETRA